MKDESIEKQAHNEPIDDPFLFQRNACILKDKEDEDKKE